MFLPHLPSLIQPQILKMLHSKLCKTFLRRWRNLIIETMTCVNPASYSRHCVKEEGEEDKVPKDVPKGHLVVYVGEHHRRRFVIDLAFLQHPLFRGLLELAREEFNYLSPGGKLCIPCDEAIFLGILQHVRSWQRMRVCTPCCL